MKEFTHALAIKLINSIKMKQVKRLLYVLFSLFLFLGIFTTIIVKAHSGDVLSAWVYVTPTIDGELRSGEWADADSLSFKTTRGHDCIVYVKNDASNIYFAVRTKDSTLSNSDIVAIFFDNDHDGFGPENGDDIVLYYYGGFKDGHSAGSHSWRTDSDWGGTSDGSADAENDRAGNNWFEFSHPLDSNDDAHDFSLSLGDTVGFGIAISIDRSGDGWWPSKIPSNWANIEVASKPEPTPPPNKKPIAYVGPDQTAYIGETVDFSGAGSEDPDGTIVSYEWDFGDDETDSGVEVSHSYSEPDSYTVTLTVMDDKGAKDTETCVVRARAEPPEPPIIDITKVILALIGLVGIFIPAYFGYRAVIARLQKT